jgi:ketosteroid isomerase-like protein
VSLSAEDSLAILQLVTEADDRASARDVDGYVELFTEDGVMTDAMGIATGRAELAATVAAVWFEEPSGTLHLTLNPMIEGTDDEPAVHSVMLMVIPGGSPRLLGVVRVRQTVRWTPEGWRISVREYLGGTS